jgi:hypothetical protein
MQYHPLFLLFEIQTHALIHSVGVAFNFGQNLESITGSLDEFCHEENDDCPT